MGSNEPVTFNDEGFMARLCRVEAQTTMWCAEACLDWVRSGRNLILWGEAA